MEHYNIEDDALYSEQLNEISQSLMNKEEHVNQTYEHLLGQKLFNYITEHLNVEGKTVSVEEFQSLK